MGWAPLPLAARQWWNLSGFILDLHPDSMQDKKQQRMWLLHGFGPSEPVVLSPRCQAWHALMMVQCTFNRKNWYFFLQCLMEDSETHNNANHHWNILALLQRSKRKRRREEKKKKRKEKKQKGKRKGLVTRYWYVKNKNSCKKDQCNKSHSLIPLHSNWTCVLKATAAGFISHPNRIKLWNSSWHKASEICVQTRTGLPLLVRADVKMFQYLLTVVRFYFFSEPL